MKILMVTDFYLPIVGGTEIYFQSLGRQLVRRGHEVSIATIGHPQLPGYEEDSGVKIYRLQGLFQKVPFLFLDERKRYPPPLRDFIITGKLARLIELVKPDIIHVHGWILYSLLPLVSKFRIPLVVNPHDYGLICPKKTLLNKGSICNKPLGVGCVSCGREIYNPLKSLLIYMGVRKNVHKLKHIDQFIFGNEYGKEVYRQYLKLDDVKASIIYSYYDTDNDGESDGDDDLPDDFILYVGALIPQKGVDLLIEAYNKLDVKTKLVLIGGTYRNHSYRTQKNILVLRDRPQRAVMNAMSRCRFAVFPIQFPSASGPLSPLEVMSKKKAIIAADIGGLKDMVRNGETGILVPPDAPDELVEAMSYLLREPEVASRMGERGYAMLREKYLPDTVIPEIVKVYRSLL